MKPFGILVVVSLLGGRLAFAADDPLFALPTPLMTVVKTPRPPTIDGKLAPGEWRYAASTTGFLNLADGNLAKEQTVVAMTCDAERLYFAFECVLATERSPAASESRRDGGVWGDESFEVFLQPPSMGEEGFYQFVGNSIGTIFDRCNGDKSWDGRWEFANDAGMGYWTAELSVPLADLGAGDPTGQTWRVNFARNAGAHTSWSYTGRGYVNPPRFGSVHFAGEAVVLRVTSINPADGGEVSISGTILNPMQEMTRPFLGARLPSFDSGINSEFPTLGTDKWRPLWAARMGAQEQREIRLTRPTRDERRKLLQVAGVMPDGPQLYRQAIPFVPEAPRYVQLLAEPSEHTAFLRVDLRGLGEGEPAMLGLRVRQRAGDFSREIRLEGLKRNAVRVEGMELQEWPLGAYDCSYTIAEMTGGKQLCEGHFDYERIEAPEWHAKGRDLGREPKLLPPWTPIQWGEDYAQVWGRRYELGQELLVAQVISQDEPLLAGPLRLECEAAGGPAEATLNQRKAIGAGDVEGAFQATGALGAFQASVTTSVEFDGMMRLDLTLQAPEATQIQALRLVIPFRPERSLYYHHAASYYARGGAGIVPAEGLKTAFRPFVWLGDNRRGLMWFAESQQGWHCDREPIEIRSTPAANELVIHFVNVPTSLRETKITFGLQATPVKPVPEDWRAWRADRVWPKRHLAKHFVDWEGEGIPLQWRYLWWTDGERRIFTPGHTTPLQVMDVLGEHVREWHEKDTRILPYMYLYGVNRIATGFERYYPVWQTSSPRQMAYHGRVIMGACPASEAFADYLLYGIAQWVEEHGVDGVYFDGAGPPVACANPLHDHGWVDDNGARQRAYPIFGLRDFYRRLWTILTDRLDRPVIWVHADGKMPVPCFSFVTANWEGEMVQGSMKSGEAYLSDLLPPEYWRARMMATQWGIVPMWLPSTFGTDEQRLRQQNDDLAIMLVHGTPFARTARMQREVVVKIWTAQHDFGIGEATFHGYWENGDLLTIQPADERVVASFYAREGRVMLVVANFTDEAREVTLQFAGEWPEASQFVDCLSEEEVPCEAGRLQVEVAPRSFRLLRR